MAKAQVSSAFQKFYGRQATAIEEAKKAENTMSNSPTPVGWSGQCVPMAAKADQGKDKVDPKTKQKVPGNLYVNITFAIVSDEKYQGKQFTKNWTFFDSDGATMMDRYTWFLNDLTNMGLPQEVRENHQTPEELLDWILNSDSVFDCECQANERDTRGDGKVMRVRKAAETVDESTSMSPTTTSTSEPVTAPDWPQVGDKVKYLDIEWEVVERDGANVTIKTEKNGESRERKAAVENLKPVS